MEKPVRVLPEEVTHVVASDNIVSPIVYEIDEREPAPRQLTEQYPALVEAWVRGSGKDGQL
jgi:hypothetical protein